MKMARIMKIEYDNNDNDDEDDVGPSWVGWLTKAISHSPLPGGRGSLLLPCQPQPASPSLSSLSYFIVVDPIIIFTPTTTTIIIIQGTIKIIFLSMSTSGIFDTAFARTQIRDNFSLFSGLFFVPARKRNSFHQNIRISPTISSFVKKQKTGNYSFRV